MRHKEKSMEEDKVLSTLDVATRYKVSLDTVRRKARTGALRGTRVTRDWKFAFEDCERFFLGKEVKEK
jgi:hypothetical protein